MNAPAPATITSSELRDRFQSSAPLRVLDVRTPAEYETAHITGSHNVPLDVLDKHDAQVAELLAEDQDVVLVCQSGQRATKAQAILRDAGLTGGRVLANGFSEWESKSFDVDRGTQKWALERQVRLVAGSVVLSAVVGSVVVPQLKWVAAAIGGGLTFAAVSNTCAMATALSKLPYNRGANTDADELLARLRGTA
ncbi:rhodanese-like domain-containing protein [Mycolicibacterium arseniciresistens]|uniref:Rhodanese-like domain-containing protein n=1 Tax=Mycolicibacterium arseniciresistens TaxID=3062257 RepID=A0ABT8UE06_9MYCO|nr:rhodanese-like domain-containing protein [Mycolicibacterium arseniciresistens]MDO3636017.1 rhodanese-like domain-containing protein [Mycolicibacterium arseniciresistens]